LKFASDLQTGVVLITIILIIYYLLQSLIIFRH